MILVVIREGEHLEPFGDHQHQLVPSRYRGRVLDKYGVPIMGATVNGTDPGTTWPPRATAATDPNGYFVLPLAGYGKYRIEVINGSETVTIQGDEIEVETVEMARAKRMVQRMAAKSRDEAAHRAQLRGLRGWRRIWAWLRT